MTADKVGMNVSWLSWLTLRMEQGWITNLPVILWDPGGIPVINVKGLFIVSPFVSPSRA